MGDLSNSSSEPPENAMVEDHANDATQPSGDAILVGYSPSWTRFFDKGALICIGLFLFLFIFGWSPQGLPFLVMAAFLLELKYRYRHRVYLRSDGLEVRGRLITWDQIVHKSDWGPLGIPLTPFKFHGVRLLLASGQSLSFSSAMEGFALLQKALKKHFRPPPSEESPRYGYPPAVMRSLRYLLAFGFTAIFALLYSLSDILIFFLFLIAGGYYLTRNLFGDKSADDPPHAGDNWLMLAGFTLVAIILLFIFSNSNLAFMVGLVPAALLIFFPWHPRPLALLDDALFVGYERAYPLVTLRALQEKRVLFFKFLRLSFVKGEIRVLPLLENYAQFKRELETAWEEARQQKFPDTAELPSPQQEARQRLFQRSEAVELTTPLSWQFRQHLRFLIHLTLFLGLPILAWYTPLGRVHILGNFLQAFLPIYLILYGVYFFMEVLPIFLYLYRSYRITKTGIFIKGKLVPWEEISMVIPYKDWRQHHMVTLWDQQGCQLATIREEMADWQLAMERIRAKVQESRGSDPLIAQGRMLSRRSRAWYRLRKLLVLLLLMFYLPLALYHLRQNIDSLAEPQKSCLTMPLTERPWFYHRLGLLTYYDCLGQPCYVPVLKKADAPSKIDPSEIRIHFIPAAPLFCTVQGPVEDLITALIGAPGSCPGEMVRPLYSWVYWIWLLALLILVRGLLHRELLPGLLLRRLPGPDESVCSLSQGERLRAFLRLSWYFLLLALLFVLAVYFYFPYLFPWDLPLRSASLWILLSLGLPCYWVLALGHYLTSILPAFRRSRRRWRIDADGISSGPITLPWNQVQSVTVFRHPDRETGRQALIRGQRQYLQLDGRLYHFEQLLERIRQNSGTVREDHGLVGRYLRKQIAGRGLVRMLAWLCGLLLLVLCTEGAWQRFQEPLSPCPTATKLSRVILPPLVWCKYQDQQQRNWYTLAWTRTGGTEIEIACHPQVPCYWQMPGQAQANWIYTMLAWLRNHGVIILVMLTLLWALALIWYLMGYVLGLPRIHP